MGLTWYGQNALKEVREKTADYILDIGLLAQQTLMDKLGTPYPPASRPGEFPHRRTGNLQRSVGLSPNTRAGVIASGFRITLYYEFQAFYGDILTAKGRLGPADVMNEVRAKLSATNPLGR